MYITVVQALRDNLSLYVILNEKMGRKMVPKEYIPFFLSFFLSFFVNRRWATFPTTTYLSLNPPPRPKEKRHSIPCPQSHD